MKYPAVKNAHIVPRSYLRQFTADDGKTIAVRFPDGPAKMIETSIDNVATRKFFYRRDRPDGSKIDDVEWSLSVLEGSTADLLKRLKDDWPLSREDETKLAWLFGLQIVRTPQWMEWHGAFTRQFVDDHRAKASTPDELRELDEAEEQLLSARHRLIRMLSLGRKLAAILGSMHWTLVEFTRPIVVTSDQPVVLWPRETRALPPQATSLDLGIFETLEIRVPVSAQHLLLLSWLDEPDDAERIVSGKRHHAAAANAFTIANCDRQWMHRPGEKPPIASGSLLPLSAQLLPGYSAATATASLRRKEAAAIIDRMKNQPDISNDDIEVVTVASNRPKAA